VQCRGREPSTVLEGHSAALVAAVSPGPAWALMPVQVRGAISINSLLGLAVAQGMRAMALRATVSTPVILASPSRGRSTLITVPVLPSLALEGDMLVEISVKLGLPIGSRVHGLEFAQDKSADGLS
jgi:hypothetical protein